MEDGAKREVFCQNFGRHWNKEHKRFFRILKECVDFQTRSMKGWDKGRILKLVSKYKTISIGRAKFLRALKKTAIQYAKQYCNRK
jgi:hypothetical protein